MNEKYRSAGTLSPAQRAANGRALLDEQGPLGWRYPLDNTLDMWNDCVLIRVYGDYGDGLDALFEAGEQDGAATYYGFCPARLGTGDTEALRDAWLAEAANAG